MRRSTVAVVGLLLPMAASAQTSAYQSADGKTSIYLANAKANLIFNASDTKFDFGYLHEGAGKSWLYGFDVTGKPSSNFATLFQKDKTPPDMGGSISLGRHHAISQDLRHQSPKDRIKDDWALVQFTYARSSFETASEPSTEPKQRHFDSFTVLAAENALVNAPGTALLVGLAAGLSRMNNLDQLQPVTISGPVIQSAIGLSPFAVTKDSSNAYYGNYRQYIGAPIYSDVVFISKTSESWTSRLGIDLFTRSQVAHMDRSVGGGVGIFVSQKNQPTQVLGGLSIGWKNGTPSVGFVAGFAF